MFTGIVSDIGTISAIGLRNDIRRLMVDCHFDVDTIAIGASIACSGVCLTVVERGRREGGSRFLVEAGPETLAVSTAREWREGTRLNLERALRMGDELGGHIVSGHVDGVATVVERQDLGETVRYVFEAPADLARFIAPKGSVALDGTSLTVNRADGNRFDCLLIPHTLAVTTWGERHAGSRVNLEVDTMARYASRLIATA